MKIIVVDDQADVLLTFQLMVKRLGHEVITYDCGAAGLERLQTDAADVLLCDLTMPHMDGYSVARAIRANQKISQPKLFAISALPSALRQPLLADAGFDGYLEKPLRIETLFSLFENLA